MATLALAAQSAPEAVAAKPPTKTPKPQTPTPAPDGGGPVDNLYFMYSGDGYTWSMNADGTGKAQLAVHAGHGTSASHALHNGHRWFLDLRLWPGDQNGDGSPDYTYPDGSERVELFALRDDAEDPNGCEDCTVQLTNDPALAIAWPWDWMRVVQSDLSVLEDLQVTFYATKWDGEQIDPAGTGTYVVDVEYDADGNVTGLGTMPGAPVIQGIRGGTWSPDATRLVYATADGLAIYDVSTGQSAVLVVDNVYSDPTWSPDGARIAFRLPAQLDTIRPDGSDRKMLAKGNARNMLWGRGNWSPTGSHVAYNLRAGTDMLRDVEIYRIAVDGSGKTNLTADLSYSAYLGCWRD